MQAVPGLTLMDWLANYSVPNDNATPPAEQEVVEAAAVALDDEDVLDSLDGPAPSGSNARAAAPPEQPVLHAGSTIRRPVRAKKRQAVEKEVVWEDNEGEEAYLQALGDLAAYDEEQEDPDHLDQRQTKLARRRDDKRIVAERLERDIKSGKKVRAPKVVKKPPKPRKDKVAGRLAGALTDLPVEITNLIFSYCDVRTILIISRFNKALYAFLHTKTSQGIWVQAWKNSGYDKTFVAEGWNEAMYAALIYDNDCQGCGGKSKHPCIELRVNFCRACAFPAVDDEQESTRVKNGKSRRMHAGSTSLVLDMASVPAMPDYDGQHWFLELACGLLARSRENLYPDHHRRGVVTGPFFLRSEVIAIGALLKDQAELDKDSDSGWQTPDDDLPEVDLTTESGILESRLRNIRPNMAAFCREERRLLMLVVEDTENLMLWNLLHSNDVHAVRLNSRDDRVLEIQRRLDEAGYDGTAIARVSSKNSVISGIVHQAHPCTDRVWKKISPKVIEAVEAYAKFRSRGLAMEFVEGHGSELEKRVSAKVLFMTRDRELDAEDW